MDNSSNEPEQVDHFRSDILFSLDEIHDTLEDILVEQKRKNALLSELLEYYKK